MRIHVTSRHARLTPAVRRHLEERLARIERYAKVSEARVVLDAQKSRHVTEIVVHVKGKELIAREESHDALGSIEAAVARLERQVKRAKEKKKAQALHDGTHPNGDEREGAVRSAARAMLAGGRAARQKAEAERPRIVPVRGLPGKPVTIDEAADELLANGLEFLAFVNSVTDQLNVLYKRKDGALGLIAQRAARRPART
jgi:putative sigma-54 modulation protein